MIDRRHVALGVALGASVATSYSAPPPLFYGEQSVDADPVWLDEDRPIRTWVITTDVVLPAEAEHDDFTSATEVRAWALDQDSGDRSEGLLVVLLGECGSEGAADGPTLHGSVWVEVEHSFEDCVPRQTCTRTFCLAIAINGDEAVEVEWYTRTVVESHAWVDDYDIEPIPVPIDITVEESDP